MNDIATIINLAYVVAAALFILGLKLLSHPDTAKRGNFVSAVGMLIAVVVTLLGFALLMPLMRAMEDGRTDAVLRILIMLSSTVYAMVFFVKSFIDARRK